MGEDRKYDPGTQRLIADLEAAPWSYERDTLLARARRLRYHDFDDAAYDAPKLALVRHLQEAGLRELATQAMNGRYDQGRGDAVVESKRSN